MTPWLDEQHIEIAAAPEVIYRYLADFNRHPGWSLSVTRVEPPAGGKFIVGAEFAMSGAAPGETWACRVMALQAPMRIAWEARGKHALEQWEFLIVPSARATTLAQRLTVHPRNAVLWPFRDRRRDEADVGRKPCLPDPDQSHPRSERWRRGVSAAQPTL